jgi:hypothetical protein
MEYYQLETEALLDTTKSYDAIVALKEREYEMFTMT